MKKLNFLLIAAVFITASVFGQDSDKPGEDFDLEALAGVIEDVDTFEELEKAINDSTNDINNLDLDENGEVDYVLIQEEAEGDTHVAFLRVAMSEDEFQDVATIEMDKLSSTTALFQIVGDSILYGKDYILEPEDGIVDISESSGSQPSDGKGGPSSSFFLPPPAVHVTVVVGVYSPGYKVYVSPYGFAVVPAWYHPRPPMARSSYRARSARWHRSHYRHTAHRKSHHAHSMQKKHRKTAYHHSSSPNKATHTSTNNKNKSQPNNTTQQKQGSSTQQKQNTTTQQKQGSSTQQKQNTSTQQKQGSSQQKKSGGSKKRRR